jgi:antirestriction protein ArdC
VFNVEQIDGLPANYYAKPAPRGEIVQRIVDLDRTALQDKCSVV